MKSLYFLLCAILVCSCSNKLEELPQGYLQIEDVAPHLPSSYAWLKTAGNAKYRQVLAKQKVKSIELSTGEEKVLLAYDSNGNLTTQITQSITETDTTSYTYNRDNKLLSISNGDHFEQRFYGEQKQLIKKVSSSKANSSDTEEQPIVIEYLFDAKKNLLYEVQNQNHEVDTLKTVLYEGALPFEVVSEIGYSYYYFNLSSEGPLLEEKIERSKKRKTQFITNYVYIGVEHVLEEVRKEPGEYWQGMKYGPLTEVFDYSHRADTTFCDYTNGYSGKNSYLVTHPQTGLPLVYVKAPHKSADRITTTFSYTFY